MNEQQRIELEQNYEDLAIRLYRFGLKQAWIFFGRRLRISTTLGRPDYELPGGMTVFDVVSGAILKLMDGTNACPEDVPLKTCLMKNVARDLMHIKQREGKRQVCYSEMSRDDAAEEPEPPEPQNTPDQMLFTSTPPPSPRGSAIESERLLTLYCSLEDDPELVTIFDLLSDGHKPQEVALLLHLDIEQIRNAQKRMRRRLESQYQDLKTV